MSQNFPNFQISKFLIFKISNSILKSAVLPASLMPLLYYIIGQSDDKTLADQPKDRDKDKLVTSWKKMKFLKIENNTHSDSSTKSDRRYHSQFLRSFACLLHSATVIHLLLYSTMAATQPFKSCFSKSASYSPSQASLRLVKENDIMQWPLKTTHPSTHKSGRALGSDSARNSANVNKIKALTEIFCKRSTWKLKIKTWYKKHEWLTVSILRSNSKVCSCCYHLVLTCCCSCLSLLCQNQEGHHLFTFPLHISIPLKVGHFCGTVRVIDSSYIYVNLSFVSW